MVATSELVLIVAAMLLSGAANTVMTKALFTSEVTDMYGDTEQFARPWIVNISMFLGMALVGLSEVPLKKCKGSWQDPASPSSTAPSLEASPGEDVECNGRVADEKAGSKPPPRFRDFLLLILPASCDLTATVLSNAGLVFIPSSTYQMLRGSSIIFAAMFSKALLGKTFNSSNRIGLVIATLGIVLVGFSQALVDRLEGSPHLSQQVLGMGLVLLGQIAQAFQVIVEERFLKDLSFSVPQIVSIQGLWGLALMVCIIYPAMYVIPGNDYDHLDDCLETLAMIASNGAVASLLLAKVLVCGALNTSALSVTKELSGVHRKMMDAMRTSIIWIFGLSVYYFVDPNSGFGEVWTRYSFVELLGFCMLIIGQMIYSELLHVSRVKATLTALDADCIEGAPPQATVVVRSSVSPAAPLEAA